MKMNKTKIRVINLIGILILFCTLCSYVFALPVGPTITLVSNSTKAGGAGTIYNESGNDSTSPDKAGGFIYTINLDGVVQNDRWKAYVGNVTGRLVLDDASGYTIYDWDITTAITGEVYATRAATTISWSSINCSNSTHIAAEEIAMNHTANPSDNISRTFNWTNNSAFYVGNTLIGADTCPTTNLFVNGTSTQNDEFEEVLLYDGTNLVYATIIADDTNSYHNDTTTDFQMILPERGYTGWASSTAYYFYVELN